MKAFAVVTLLALAAFFGYGWGREQSEGEGRPVTMPVDQASYEARVEALTIDRDGWRARFEGVTRVMPDTVYVVDTLVQAPDTVLRFVSVDSRGRLGIELLSRADSTPDVGIIPLYRPELHAGADVSGCDEGWTIANDGTVTCDAAKLGHAWIGPSLSRSPSIALWWKPAYRSPWEVAVSYDGRRFDFGIRRGLRLW